MDEPKQLLAQGIAHARLAIQADGAGNKVDALQYYDMTIQYLQQAVQVDPVPSSRNVTEQKLMQYRERTVVLKREILKAGGQLPSPARTASGSFSTQSNNNMQQNNGNFRSSSPSVQRPQMMGPQGPTTLRGGNVNKGRGMLVQSVTGVQYYIGDKLGGGNFGVVHNCLDAFDRDFVIKSIRPGRKREELEKEWAKEVQFLYSLNHPNIVRLFDAFEWEEKFYMVMERCSGSVRDYVKRHGSMDGPQVIDCAGQILSGLNHIHSRDIIHRDLHIDNVLYAQTRAGENVCIKISDFGISKMLKADQKAAVTFIGRDYDYAPELVTKGHTTKRSDIYQCGLVLYHLYTGKHVLSSKDGSNVVQVITSGVAGQRAKSLNTKLGDVIAVMLRREPDYRFKDAMEAWAAIYAILHPNG
mmetsp:Transcript_13520/g.23368  ORF Transcript_13520/g.23368 Transcript_13520/m.23368 type:complete len:413 (-) Transcript_13520:109-1347(-)